MSQNQRKNFEFFVAIYYCKIQVKETCEIFHSNNYFNFNIKVDLQEKKMTKLTPKHFFQTNLQNFNSYRNPQILYKTIKIYCKNKNKYNQPFLSSLVNPSILKEYHNIIMLVLCFGQWSVKSTCIFHKTQN